jgi:hypothetical protein
MKYCGSVDFLVDFRGFMDFQPEGFMDAVCVDLDGSPIRVPWLWDHEYKGVPFYWGCTNNPVYQAYLRDQTERVCTAPIDGLHIDDYSGTSHCSEYRGGCFCDYCVQGFHEYLASSFSEPQLRELGILSIDRFNYRDFLRSSGIGADDFRTDRRKCPLGNEFQDYQNSMMEERIRETYEYAEKLRGIPLLRSVNSSASSPRTILPSPVIDYFCGEVPHHASNAEISTDPVFVYRMVEALGRSQTATASGQDWAWVKANEKPGLVRTWIAQAYAFGSVFMVPHRQWCFTQELGTHWWIGKPEDFAYLYRFVREQNQLLDGYRSLSNIALVYTNSNYTKTRKVARELTESGIPYSIIVAEEELCHDSPVDRYEILITGIDPIPQVFAQKLTGKVVSGSDLNETLSRQVDVIVDGSERTYVSLRYDPISEGKPVVCHLLNQNYSFDADDVTPVSVRVSVSKSLLKKAGKPIVRYGVIHTPGRSPIEIEVTDRGDMISFQVDQLGLWCIVSIQ